MGVEGWRGQCGEVEDGGVGLEGWRGGGERGGGRARVIPN